MLIWRDVDDRQHQSDACKEILQTYFIRWLLMLWIVSATVGTSAMLRCGYLNLFARRSCWIMPRAQPSPACAGIS